MKLAQLLSSDGQFYVAEEAAFRTIDLFLEEGDQYQVCQSHLVLGQMYRSNGEIKKAIHHFEVVRSLSIGTVSCFGLVATWRTCFALKTDSMTHRSTSNTPSRTRSTTNTAWMVWWRFRP